MAEAVSSEESPERALLIELDSPKKTVRAAAIVKAAKIAKDPLIIRKLQMIEQSQDRELSLVAKQAIARIQSRVGELKATSFNGTSLTRENLLLPLPVEVPLVLKYIREDPNRVSEDLRATVAEFLGKHGAATDAEYLLQWLAGTTSLLALPFIEALEILFPKSLLTVLPNLLASEVPLVRVRAILTLRRIDPDEAAAHFSELIGSRKAEERLAGISIAFMFPFEQVKHVVLALLRTEIDDDVIAATEIFFSTNPEEDTALRLLDLLETLPKEQTAGVGRIFKGICGVLEKAQILPAEQARPEAMVARWKRERLKKFLIDLEVQITVCDKERLETIEAWLKKNIQHPDVAEFVETLSQSPATEEIYQRLTVGVVPESPAELNWESPVSQQPAAKRRMLESLDASKFNKIAPWIRNEAAKGIPTIRTAALNAIRTFDPTPPDSDLAEEAIKADDPKIVLAGVKLLEKARPFSLPPYLPRLLRSRDLSVLLKAVRIALKSEAKKAIDILAELLKSKEAPIRAQAVACLMICPFDQVMDMLMEALLIETNHDIAQKILLILNSNPGAKVLRSLDKIQATRDPAVTIMVAQVRAEMFELILKYGYEAFDESTTEGKVSRSQPAKPPSPETEAKIPISAPEKNSEAVSRKTERRSDHIKAPDEATPATKVHPLFARKTPPQKSDQIENSAGLTGIPYSVSEVRNAIRRREADIYKAAAKWHAASSSQRKIIMIAGIAVILLVVAGLLFLR
ncbi:MAG: hypothetical protein HQM09_17460 [Candidatus Riflebacteria bacterium]|nr:hypothetical protein [Candidatus Riflebacteria bacterium]